MSTAKTCPHITHKFLILKLYKLKTADTSKYFL